MSIEDDAIEGLDPAYSNVDPDRFACQFPGHCCMPGEHLASECHTAEMLETFTTARMQEDKAASLRRMTDRMQEEIAATGMNAGRTFAITRRRQASVGLIAFAAAALGSGMPMMPMMPAVYTRGQGNTTTPLPGRDVVIVERPTRRERRRNRRKVRAELQEAVDYTRGCRNEC